MTDRVLRYLKLVIVVNFAIMGYSGSYSYFA